MTIHKKPTKCNDAFLLLETFPEKKIQYIGWNAKQAINQTHNSKATIATYASLFNQQTS
jgi:hypothetical protein